MDSSDYWKNHGKEQKKHWKKIGKDQKKKWTPVPTPGGDDEGQQILAIEALIGTPGDYWKNHGKEQKKHWKKIGKDQKKKWTPVPTPGGDDEGQQILAIEALIGTPGDYWKNHGKEQKKHWKKIGKDQKKKWTPVPTPGGDDEGQQILAIEALIGTPGDYWKNHGKEQKKHWKKIGKDQKKKWTPVPTPGGDDEGQQILAIEALIGTPGDYWKNHGKEQKKYWKDHGKQERKHWKKVGAGEPESDEE
ncbi:unnamed protein product [[Candida] boidinii]|nr:unnamed protein product [[Candida] boidinii]